MPPPSQAILYTGPVDIAGSLGASGLKLRLDDDGLTAGVITGATNANPIVITSVGHGLNTGNLAQITGVLGNDAANGMWFITRLTVDTFSIPIAGNGTYVTGGTLAGILQPEAGWLLNAANIGTATVNRYCQTLYDTADLALSWSVYNWATWIATQWLCIRRGNPIPSSILNAYLETLDNLEMVKSQQMCIEDIGLRNTCMPCWSNVRIDQRWNIKKMRVETVLSDRTHPNFPQKQDFGSVALGPMEPNTW